MKGNLFSLVDRLEENADKHRQKASKHAMMNEWADASKEVSASVFCDKKAEFIRDFLEHSEEVGDEIAVKTYRGKVRTLDTMRKNAYDKMMKMQMNSENSWTMMRKMQVYEAQMDGWLEIVMEIRTE